MGNNKKKKVRHHSNNAHMIQRNTDLDNLYTEACEAHHHPEEKCCGEETGKDDNEIESTKGEEVPIESIKGNEEAKNSEEE